MTTYHDRDEWTSTDASGVTLTGGELVGAAFHWPGTDQSIIGVESQSQVAARLRGYRRFHVVVREWRDIGYNIAFDQAGRVWMLRSTAWGVNMVGAHCASTSNPRANHKYVGCLLILGANEKPSAAMLEAINDWYHRRFLSRWFGRTDARGHGQVPGASTNCPGPSVRSALGSGAIPGTQEGDMPTATELLRARIQNRITGKTIELGDLLSFLHEDGYQLNVRQPRIEAKIDALLAATEGLDTEAILARIDQRSTEDAARDAEIAGLLAAQRDLLSEHASGTLDAEAVVQRWREVLAEALAD